MTNSPGRPFSGSVSRRSLLKATAAIPLLAATARYSFAQETKTIGFLAAGPWNDFGYTQSHLEAINELAKDPALKILKEEGVPETADVQKSIRSMIELDGASIIVGTAYGYFDPHMIDAAKRYADVRFLHCAGVWQEGMPKNLTTYYAHCDEVSYLVGVVAGKMATNDNIGFVGSKPIPDVVRVVNGFALGVRSVRPTAKISLVMTGEWSDPVKEANAANSLIDQGASVVGCDVDSPKVVIETCERRGILCTGHHVDQSSLAPKTFLTGSEWNWAAVYKAALSGTISEQNVRGGLAEDMVRISPFGPSVPDEVKTLVEGLRADFVAGTKQVYVGPIKDNTGKDRIPAGATVKLSDTSLQTVDWLVEGIVGSVS